MRKFQVLRFAGPHTRLAIVLLLGVPMLGAPSSPVQNVPEKATYVLVGFVGGFVRHTNPHHGPVIVAQKIRQFAPQGSHIQVYENRHRKTAYRDILHLLDMNRDGVLSPEEKSRARIILFGQSWGGSAVVTLARELDRVGIPVMLTVQVDSIAKPWQQHDVIPDNVAAAVNFYQPHGILHGLQLIRAADNSKTQILGNYRFDYKENPVKCDGMAWLDRTLTPDHMQSECDPHLWGEVEGLVRQRLEPEPEKLALIPTP
jgi:hypothetical protein